MVAAITRGEITINGINPTHFGAFSKVMKDSGILLDEVNANKDALFIHTCLRTSRLLKLLHYPTWFPD